MKDNFYENAQILVTGGCGFIGSSLVRELLKEKANVVVFDNMLIGDEQNLREIKNKIKIVVGDIRNKELFHHVLLENEIDYCFNLAAEPYIPHCYERPEEFFTVNANGALNVMLACKEAGVKRILQYSTSEVYGGAKQIPMDEHHMTNPISTYAVSKLAADRLAFTLFHEQKVPIIILRQFNCFSGDTEVMTPEGIKNIKDFKIGDKTFTLNPETKEIEITKVIATISKDVESLFEIKHRTNLDFIVSEDHRFFLRNHQRNKFHWYTAKQLSKKNNQYSFPLHKPKKNGNVFKSKTELKIIAWYISEGYVVLPYEIRICQKNKENREEISKLIKSYKGTLTTSQEYLALSDKKFAKWISKNCGSGSHNKKIPKEIFYLNLKEREVFFETIMKGDGTKNRMRYSTVSKKLAEDMLFLGFLNGYQGYIRKEISNVVLPNKTKKLKREIYRVDFRKKRPISLKTEKHVRKLKQKTKVYCITTEKNHIIYAGRNYHFNWVGQCLGPRETQPYVIPEIITQLSKGNILKLGNLNATRDFTYVHDAAKSAIRLMMHKEAEGQVFNSGTGKDYSVKNFADMIADLMGKKRVRIVVDKKRLRPMDVERLQCNFFKLHMLTGWKPETDIREGLRRTIEWFMQNHKKWIWEDRTPMEKVWGKGIYEKDSNHN